MPERSRKFTHDTTEQGDSMQPHKLDLRALKGAPATILLALFQLGGQAGTNDLVLETGYSDKTVTAACKVLKHYDFVTRATRYDGWFLITGGRQLPLTWSEVLLDKPVDKLVDSCGENPANRKVSGSAPTTTTTLNSLKTNNESLNPLSESVVVEVDQTNRNYSGSPAGQANQAILEVLRSAGIGEPMRSKLACLDHVDLKYVKAHAIQAKYDHTDIALLIHRIRSNDVAPEVCWECNQPIDHHADDCPTVVVENLKEYIYGSRWVCPICGTRPCGHDDGTLPLLWETEGTPYRKDHF